MTISVNTKVAERILEIGPQVEDKVIGVLVGRELDRRSQALTKALDDLSTLEKNFAKIDKPDVVSYNEKGKPAIENYSKSKLEEIKKAKEKIDRFTKAINKALEKGEFKDVYDIDKQPAPKSPGEDTE